LQKNVGMVTGNKGTGGKDLERTGRRKKKGGREKRLSRRDAFKFSGELLKTEVGLGTRRQAGKPCAKTQVRTGEVRVHRNRRIMKEAGNPSLLVRIRSLRNLRGDK